MLRVDFSGLRDATAKGDSGRTRRMISAFISTDFYRNKTMATVASKTRSTQFERKTRTKPLKESEMSRAPVPDGKGGDPSQAQGSGGRGPRLERRRREGSRDDSPRRPARSARAPREAARRGGVAVPRSRRRGGEESGSGDRGAASCGTGGGGRDVGPPQGGRRPGPPRGASGGAGGAAWLG